MARLSGQFLIFFGAVAVNEKEVAPFLMSETEDLTRSVLVA